MEVVVLAMAVAFVLRDPAGTLRAATAHKRAQIERDRLKGKGARSRRPGHRAFRNYLGTVWQARWEEASRRYPAKMAKANARRDKRRARRAEKWQAAKDAAGRRWEARRADPGRVPLFDRGDGADGAAKDPDPGPEAGPVPEGVVDLEEARRRREEAAGPGETPGETPPESTTPETEKEGAMPLDLSDAASLRSHLAALRGYGAYWDKTSNAKERLASNMRGHSVGEATVGAVDASRDASTSAAAAARQAAQALEDANMGVAEARAGSPDAGDGTYYEHR